MKTLSIHAISDLPKTAQAILENIDSPIVLFYGDMGVGKTTLIKQLAASLGANAEEVVSPTFSLINVYQSPLVGEIYHFDLYRLTSPDELMDIGFEDYINSGSFCFIEWPQLTERFFKTHYSTIHISVENNGIRTLQIKNY